MAMPPPAQLRMRRQSGSHSLTPRACWVRKVSSVTRCTEPMRPESMISLTARIDGANL